VNRRALVVACLAAVAVLAVLLLRAREGAGPDTDGQGHPGLSAEERRELDRIATLGYIAGKAPVPEKTGVTLHTPERAYQGCTVLTFARGARAVLIGMDGRIVHSWSRPGAEYWARAHVYANGEVLAVTSDPYRVIRLDRDSRLIWESRALAHHDCDVLDDGTICVAAREVAYRPGIHDGAPLLDDHILILDDRGREIRRVSLLEAFERSERYRGWLAEKGLPEGPDIFHTNSVEVLTVKPSLRVLVSIRTISTLAIVDLDRREVEWALAGSWRLQHEARWVDGNILFFDNLGLGDRSRVLEIDPETSEIVWSYTADDFFTKGAGAEQRLPNGNTLITESEDGRVIEVTPAGEAVWEYVNPLTTEPGGNVVLGIMRAERLPSDFTLAWAGRAR